MNMIYVAVIVGEKENLILGHVRNDFCSEIVVMGHFKAAPRETRFCVERPYGTVLVGFGTQFPAPRSNS